MTTIKKVPPKKGVPARGRKLGFSEAVKLANQKYGKTLAKLAK